MFRTVKVFCRKYCDKMAFNLKVYKISQNTHRQQNYLKSFFPLIFRIDWHRMDRRIIVN